jgi:RNA polymerase sigma-70 factor (ECF subfamily)
MTDDDRHLLLCMHSGDQRAAAMLYARFGPRLVTLAGLLVRDASLGQDIAQDAFIRVLRCSRAELAAVENVGAWLTTIARRLAMNAIRAQSRDARRVMHSHGAFAPCIQPVDDFNDLRIAVDRLDEADREMIILKHVGSLTFEQIGAALGEPRSTVATRYHAAVQRLRLALAGAEVTTR